MHTRHRLLRGLAALALSILGAMQVDAQSLDVQEWKEVRLLDDRLRVSLPATARIAGMNYSIMEAPKPQETEARVFVDIGKLKLVIVVTELFERSKAPMMAVGTDHAHKLEQAFKLPPLAVSVGANPIPGIETAVLSPASPVQVSDAYLQKTLLVRRTDGALMLLGFFVGDPAADSNNTMAAVIDRAAASISPGSRALRSGANVRLEGTPITLDLPEGYTAYSQPGPDFDVYWVVRLSQPEEGHSRMGVYIGNHPRSRSAPPTARPVDSKAFGGEAKWLEWEDASGVARCEAFVAKLGHQSLSGHVFIAAASAADRDELLHTIASAKFD